MSSKTTRNEFHLPSSVVEKYLKMPDPFGFNGLGAFVYKRTYSRVKADGTHEAWAETVERVVNGTYSLQKDHVINHSLGWDEEKAKKSAIEMFDLIFHLKFTPPGRGLWAMGTKITEDRGIFAALNNCAYVSTKDVSTEKSKPFRFLMDMSMLGVGCGFDVDGRETCEIKELRGFVPIVTDDPDIEIIYKKNSKKEKTISKYISLIEDLIAKSKSRLDSMAPDDMVRGSVESDLAMYNRELALVKSYDKRAVVPHVIDDTREGWVVATGKIIDSYFDGGYPVIFDYSKIRKEGIPLKTFGGLSSGPVPLIDLHVMIRDVMGKNAGQPITLRTIVDIMNLIGKCVVAGNVRRSSEIALGPLDNEEFTDLKNYSKNPDRMAYGWCSNNSVYAEIGMDYTEIAKRIVDNGEPGVFWLKNAQAYSRMMDPPDNKDIRARGTNPCCFAGSSLVAVADGRNAVRIDELAEAGDDVPVWSWNPIKNIPELKWARAPQRTGRDIQVMKITLDDNSSITVTPDHKMMLTGGSFIQADQLEVGDSLQRFDKRIDNKYYKVNGTKRHEHNMLGEFYHPDKFAELTTAWIEGGHDEKLMINVHHENEDKLDNSRDNLHVMTKSEHMTHHGKQLIGEANPMFGRKHSETTKQLIGNATKQRYADPVYVAKHKASYSTEVRGKLGDKMKVQKAEMDHQYYLELEKKAAEVDLATRWVTSETSGNQILKIVLACDTCDGEMLVKWGDRNTAFCSTACQNKDPTMTALRTAGQKAYFENKQENTRHQQILTFRTLEAELGKRPMKKQWENRCRESKISFRLNKNATNPFMFKNFKELIEAANDYNHTVVSIELLEEKIDVYNLTVEDNHTIGIITKVDDTKNEYSGIYTRQSEQTLESYELCCLCEVYPDKHKSKEDFLRTLKFAYLYAKSVTLGDSHWVETNRVMKRNRRIGCSVTGLVQFIASRGLHTLKTWLTEGYDTIQYWDQVYSEYLTIPRSVKTTSVKPSGCVTLDTKVNVAKKGESEQSITMQELFEHCGVDLSVQTGVDLSSQSGEQWSTWTGEQWHDVSSYGLTTTSHTGTVQPINKLFINGVAECYEIPLDNGSSIKCTAEHKFMVRRNNVDTWVRCDQLQDGDEFTSM